MAENADIVRRAFDAFSRRDLSALLAICDPEVEFMPATARVAGRGEPYSGHEGLRTYLADVARVWQELRSEPAEFIEVDDVVVCTGRVYAWGVGRVIDSPAGWVWRLRDGKLVEGRVYDNQRAALAAAGLETEHDPAYARAVTYEPVEIEAEGATLAGDRWLGAGATMVLLHAGVCDRRSWREVGAVLGAAGRDVVAYDRRGFGDVPPASASFRHVDDLLAVLDAVSPEAPVWLVGSSMGGGVALDAALEAPARIAGLVLLAPAISGDPPLDEEEFDAATDGLAGAIDAAWTAGALEECNRLEVRLWLDGPAGPEGRVGGPPRELAFAMNRIVIANGEPDADGASGLDAAGRLHEIAMPAIVACGELDVAVKARRCIELADALANATYRSLPGRAHLPYLEAPEEIAALLMDAVA